MERMKSRGAIAAIVVGACLAGGVQAQNKPVQPWQPQQGEQDPAKRVPQPTAAGQGESTTAQPQAWQAAPAQAPAYAASDYVTPDYEQGRGGAFIGVSAGKGWVYEGVSQSARQLSAGYRWQAGPVALLGVEAAAGKLSSTTRNEDGWLWQYGAVDFASIGFTGRFNFGRHSPVYGLVRTGYWAADGDVDNGSFEYDVDGGYVGLGLGADIGRHFSLSLTFTSYVYFNELYWDDREDELVYDANRADTLLFGGEFRF